MIRFVHIRSEPNTGDLASCPADYFDFAEAEVFNYSDSVPAGGTVVYGGGTMVNWLNMGGRLTGDRNILWGAGSSRRGEIDPWSDPEGFDLLGIREWTQEREAAGRYVPCVSCMSPLFDHAYEITRPAVRFINASASIRSQYPMGADDLPTMDNSRPLAEIVAFLGSADVIVTDSYHGVYWGTLLGRRAVCQPYSSKFRWFKFPPVLVSDATDWREAAESARVYPDALADCRRVNAAFYDRVKDLAA